MQQRVINTAVGLVLLFLAGCGVSVNTTTLDFGSTETQKIFMLTVQGSLEWSIECDEDWVDVEPDDDQGPGAYNVTVTVDRTGLDPGDYEATLNISTNPSIDCPDITVKMRIGTSPLPITVEGTVYENGTNSPINGVLVSIDGNTATTASNGYYSINVAQPGTYTLIATKEGYHDYSSTINVTEDYIEYDIHMVPEGITTSSTTTTSTGNPPDPYFDPNNYTWVTEYHYNNNGICTGITVYLSVENRGGAGEVYMETVFEGHSDCVIVYMDSGEERLVGGFDFDSCPSNNYSIKVEQLKAASLSEYPECKKPPVTKIISPSDDSLLNTGESISFEGEAKYSYDGILTGDSLVWTSSIDGKIGTGTSFTKDDLTPGSHTITLTATDSLDDTGTDSIDIFVDISDRKVWEFDTGDNVDSSPAVLGGYVYVGGDDGKVYCLNSQTGDKVWEFGTGDWGSIESSPAVSGNFVYVGSNDIKVYCLDAQTGNKVWMFKIGDYYVNSSPAVLDGRVYVGSDDGKLYCIRAAEGDTGSWPMFKCNPERTGAK